ncbi:MAG: hypothetical protein MPK62_02530 [Alphaproteobacteria bacterium]|nr:hypothetical protein [Alphaproteobacteria bacterium]MDA8030008.1 hypothetical protein [Alphaproteobacteria bacterium]
MAHDPQKLRDVLSAMKVAYLADPDKSVRAKQFIGPLQDYCAEELRILVDHMKIDTSTELNLQTPYGKKRVDVVSIMKNNGPMITISVKSQMSSIMKNFNHYYEGAIGDVTAIHKRFPFSSSGMIWLFPLSPIKPTKTNEIANFEKIEKMLNMATGRINYTDDISKHESFCMLVVDFSKDPPEIVSDYPQNDSLKIDNFFDKLVNIFMGRTPSID